MQTNQLYMSKDKELANIPDDKELDFTMEPNFTSCMNCEEEHEVGFEFCPHCGQKTNENLTVGVLFYNTITNYFSFDARFLKSFFPLLLKPGILAKRFVSGKRLMYLHPAQMYLFISVVFFFLFSFKVREYNADLDKALEKGFELEKSKDSININPIDSATVAKLSEPLKAGELVPGMTEDDKKELDSIITLTTQPQNVKNNFSFGYDTVKLDSIIDAGGSEKEQLALIGMKEDSGFMAKLFYRQILKFHKNKGGGILQALFDSIPISLFILLPIFAMILKVFFWRRGTFAHHLVFSFYYFSFLFVTMCIVLSVNYFIDVPDWIDWLVVMSTFFYLVVAMKTFYQQGYIISFIKASMASFIYMMFVVPIAAMIMLGLSFMFY